MSETGPYETLEPRRPATTSGPAVEPGALRVFARGLTKRCPRCGERDVFRRWLVIRDRCPRCRLRLEREEGGFLGAMTLNFAVTTIVWLVLLVAWMAADLPDVNVAGLLVTSLALVVVFPLAFYPFSKTTWAAVDYLVYRSQPGYAADVAGDQASGNGHSARRP